MEFPAAALLFLGWFLLTPTIRIILWLFRRPAGRRLRLLTAHGASFAIIVVITVFVLSGPETAGMALLFAIGQIGFFIVDFIKISGEAPAA